VKKRKQIGEFITMAHPYHGRQRDGYWEIWGTRYWMQRHSYFFVKRVEGWYEYEAGEPYATGPEPNVEQAVNGVEPWRAAAEAEDDDYWRRRELEG
jgi:hypothetical protein